MNKREMIHTLIDKLLDVEETSQKGANFSYSTQIGFSFYFKARPGSGYEWVGSNQYLYTGDSWDMESQFSSALCELAKVQNTPDIEPLVSVKITESKAKELGLIA